MLPGDAVMAGWHDAIVLRKPYRAAALLDCIARALDRAAAARSQAQRSILGDP
jgi:FixJ family two-component response regulator